MKKMWVQVLILGLVLSLIVPIIAGIVTYNCYKGKEADSEIKEVSELVIRQLRVGGARTTYDDLGKFFDFDIVVESAIMKCGYENEITYEIDTTKECLSAYLTHGESKGIIRVAYDYSQMVLLVDDPLHPTVKVVIITITIILLMWLIVGIVTAKKIKSK